MTTDARQQTASMLRSPRRVALALIGVICVGLGLAGVVVPGLPTTVFLIVASYCFTRSCPWLEQRLVRTRVFRPYLRYLDGDAPMPLRARVVALAMMWTAVAASVWAMHGRGPDWFASVVSGAALVGSVVVLRWRR